VTVPGRKQLLRHLVAISQALHTNGAAGKTYLLNYDRTLAWAALVSFLGLPADPRWGDWIMDRLWRDKKIEELQGIGCEPVMVMATRDSLIVEISQGLRDGELGFPQTNGPILWPSFKVQDVLKPAATREG
jgi:hypothetical protein